MEPALSGMVFDGLVNMDEHKLNLAIAKHHGYGGSPFFKLILLLGLIL